MNVKPHTHLGNPAEHAAVALTLCDSDPPPVQHTQGLVKPDFKITELTAQSLLGEGNFGTKTL